MSILPDSVKPFYTVGDYISDIARCKNNPPIRTALGVITVFDQRAKLFIGSLGLIPLNSAFTSLSRYPVRPEDGKIEFQTWRKDVEEKCPGSKIGIVVDNRFYSLKEPKLTQLKNKLFSIFTK